MCVIDMEIAMFTFDVERVSDGADIETLLNTVFGPDRLGKASYALRHQVDPVRALCLVSRHENGVAASVRFWPVFVRDLIGEAHSEALLLGPLAVDPEVQGCGVGSSLVQFAIGKTEKLGYSRILLVGDADYYGRFGFVPVLPSFITLPGGRDARRLLVRQPASLASLPAVGKLMPWSREVELAPIAEQYHVPALAI